MRLRSVTSTSLLLACLALMGCTESPYLRDVRPVYDEKGQLIPDYYGIPKPYLKHMLADLRACYAEEH
jgi:hypothetical protein